MESLIGTILKLLHFLAPEGAWKSGRLVSLSFFSPPSPPEGHKICG